DACIDRAAGVVDVFFAALYFDQRPTAASVRLLLDGGAMPAATVDTAWPWLLVDYRMPIADYASRVGADGSLAVVSIASDNRFTPRIGIFFSRTEWLDPCVG